MTDRGHLDPGDAEFVEVIHTNGGSLWTGDLGVDKPVGHVDYYPNGGTNHPGCNPFLMEALLYPISRYLQLLTNSYYYYIKQSRIFGDYATLV